ncbi:ATP synthase regulation protein NCA2-domain-containing protein [Geopyxis carbonaria]|nr:ATP synthase regulation protein NCA2-domain-containing protein [Geopyxis carbonaria]
MTFVSDQISRLDAQLDKLQLIQLNRIPQSYPSSPISESGSNVLHGASHDGRHHLMIPSEHGQSLQRIIRQLGTTSERGQPVKKLISLLKEANITSTGFANQCNAGSENYRYERELEWILLSKAAIQTYGIVLNSLVDQTLPLSEDLFYWDEILSSYRLTAIYWLQTSPQRILSLFKDIGYESLRRFELLRAAERPSFLRHSSENVSTGMRCAPGQHSEPLSATAKKFYALVKNTIWERAHIYRLSAISPLALARNEIRQRQVNIQKLREMQASALGVLIGEGLSFEFDEENDEWRGIIERAVLLMENVIRNVCMVDHSLDEFEETVFTFDRPRKGTDEGKTCDKHSLHLATSRDSADSYATAALSSQLQRILVRHLPTQAAASRNLIKTNGRPGVFTRYWLPATALLLSSTTIVRIVVNSRQGIETWIKELRETTIDFWLNWVVEPLHKIVGIIRHKEDSEVALMSRKSLTADMDSLQRMVVDFAIDNPTSISNSTSLSPTEIDLVRNNVREGDLTPVLKAYEHDLRSPFKGAVRGELIRALLIQIQKTKVDVEVAISGIDRLLKSQELVFGFVGVTPGVLISLFTVRWIASLFRRSKDTHVVTTEQMTRRLRNVDKILTGSTGMRGENGGCLDYKEHGLLLCEVHILRQDAKKVLKRNMYSREEYWNESDGPIDDCLIDS